MSGFVDQVAIISTGWAPNRRFGLPDIDPAAIGLPVAAWVRLRPGPGQLGKLAELARRTPQVSECHRVSGEDCFLLKVHVESIEDLEPVLDAFLLFGQTTSSFVVATPVAPRPPRPRSRPVVDRQ